MILAWSTLYCDGCKLIIFSNSSTFSIFDSWDEAFFYSLRVDLWIPIFWVIYAYSCLFFSAPVTPDFASEISFKLALVSLCHVSIFKKKKKKLF